MIVSIQRFLQAQILFLLSGAIFAWNSTIQNFIRFYGYEGTIFKIKDCFIPNPVTEPCFYGALGFLIALLWSIYIYRNRNKAKTTKYQHYLWWFLAAGTIFAWYNVAKEFIAFYGAGNGPVLGCSATPITNPFLTPCFAGASIFLLGTIVAGIIYSQQKNKLNHNV